MLLQLAIDRPESIALVPQVAQFVDILEVGTGLLKRYGLSAISTLRELAPDVPILADTKTVDGGTQEAEMVFNAGAMFMTVLSCAAKATHQVVSDVAEKYGAHIVVDTLTERGILVREGLVYPQHFDYVCVHAPTDARLAGDVSPSTYIDSISVVRALGYKVALAGGIGTTNLASAIIAAPEIVIVGRAITTAEDPKGTAEWMKSQLPNAGHGWPWEMK
jgi:3-hexulose-6-phosphate synthase